MAQKTLPTLLEQRIVRLNPEVCDIHLKCARIRFPDGGGQIIHGHYKVNPAALRDLLFEWLSQQIDAVQKEFQSGKLIGKTTLDADGSR